MKRILVLVIPLLAFVSAELSLRHNPPQVEVQRTNRRILYEFFELPTIPMRVLLGSSIFYEFAPAGPSTFNLGFAGGNAYTGLIILRDSNKIPETIFVEMGLNSLLQCDGAHEGVMTLYDSINFSLNRRELFHLTRREYNFHQLLRSWARGYSGKASSGNAWGSQEWHDRALASYIDRQKKRYQQGYYKRDRVKELLQKEKTMIDDLVEKGCRVFLVRPPEAGEYYKVRQREYAIEEMVFPKNQYHWIDLNRPDLDFQTSDGIHLVYEDSKTATTLLFQEAERLQPAYPFNVIQPTTGP